jgi:hypothetical protein
MGKQHPRTPRKYEGPKRFNNKGNLGINAKDTNLSKAFNFQQGKDEGLTEFMSHLKDQMRKHAGLDLEDPLGQEMLKFHFVTNSWPDVAKKITKTRKLEK